MKTLTAMIIVGSRAAIVLVGLLASASWTMACVLDEILEVRDDQEKSRDISRHPKETLLFFDVRPGMTVVETLPGQGWYSKILVPYIGPKGHFIAANYPLELFAKVFGARWGSMRQQFEDWPETFPMRARTFAVDAPKISTYSITAAPHDLSGSVDRILFIRSLHHLNRFDGRMLESSARESFRLLKVGGIAGVGEVTGPIGLIYRDISPNYGFTAIIVVFLGRLHPVGIVFSSLIIALTYLGAEDAQLFMQIPAAVGFVFQGLVLFYLLGADLLVNYKLEFKKIK